MVGYVFSEYYERDGDICNRDGSDIRAVKFAEALDSGEEGEVGIPFAECVLEQAEVDYLKCFVAGCDTDSGEDCGYCVSCEDTDDERDHFKHFLAVYRASDGYEQSYKSANKRYVRRAEHYRIRLGDYVACCVENFIAVDQNVRNDVFERAAFGKVADCVTCQRKSDDCDGRSDDDCGHKFVEPLDACEFDYYCDDDVYQSCEDRAEDKSEISQLHGYAACECRAHRSEECERTAQEHGAAEFGEKQINERSYACSEQCCGCAHSVSYDHRHGNGCSHDCQQLLQSKYDCFAPARLVLYIINEFHKKFSFGLFISNSAFVEVDYFFTGRTVRPTACRRTAEC